MTKQQVKEFTKACCMFSMMINGIQYAKIGHALWVPVNEPKKTITLDQMLDIWETSHTKHFPDITFGKE